MVESYFKFDKDNSGYLDMAEFREEFLENNKGSTLNWDDFINEDFKAHDKNGDGKISKEEVRQLWIDYYTKHPEEI